MKAEAKNGGLYLDGIPFWPSPHRPSLIWLHEGAAIVQVQAEEAARLINLASQAEEQLANDLREHVRERN